jgi:hypothetical protein
VCVKFITYIHLTATPFHAEYGSLGQTFSFNIASKRKISGVVSGKHEPYICDSLPWKLLLDQLPY